jgi:hypothetical protein
MGAVPQAPVAVTAPPLVAPQVEERSSPGSAPSLSVVASPVVKPSRWHLGVSALVLFQDFRDDWYENGNWIPHYSREGTWGGSLSLGYSFSRVFGANLYGGLRYGSSRSSLYGHAGLDLEILPFRLPITENYDLFQLGFLVGASTTGATDTGNIGSFHVGARFNLNLGPDFSITAASRANLGVLMFEGGIITRL